VAGQVVVLGGVFAALIAGVGVSFAPQLLGVLQVSDAVLAVGVDYARLMFALSFGFVFLFLFNAILNGAGDSATPLQVSLLMVACALPAEWALIFGNLGAPELGVRGVVLGLAVGQAVAIAPSARRWPSRWRCGCSSGARAGCTCAPATCAPTPRRFATSWAWPGPPPCRCSAASW